MNGEVDEDYFQSFGLFIVLMSINKLYKIIESSAMCNLILEIVEYKKGSNKII